MIVRRCPFQGLNYSSFGAFIARWRHWGREKMTTSYIWYGASWQIHKIADCACAGNTGNVSPRRRLQMKPLVSDPGMHHGTCVTHVPWCMSGSLFRGGGENVPGIPGARPARNFTHLARGPYDIGYWNVQYYPNLALNECHAEIW